ncbi:MAG: DUF1343 domain-containing protein [Lentisphaerae bacterium]|jgi:uncharacterized protein YbbC (DUF1343 family)|nr:DUF1343 domain-containing protein [Lentisphaerota bacterium]
MLNGIDNRDQVLSSLGDRRVGLITNPSGVDKSLVSTADWLGAHCRLTALFGPEHGIRGECQAGHQIDDDFTDSVLGLPVFSLHGKRRRLSDDLFDLFDVLCYDIQDVGARFYTYLYTLSYSMEDCAKRGVPVVVFDRINPLGGELVEGVRLDPEQNSFVGMYRLPTRYALTVGEYARYINSEFNVGCDLTVVPCQGYSRSLPYSESGMSWVMPSPNIPTWESALIYIGTCLFEGTNISEGRGTTRPFELVGAPFINANRLADTLNALELPGCRWRPVHFTPTFSKFEKELCHGVQLHATNVDTFRPFEAGLRLYEAIRDGYSEFRHLGGGHFDRIVGTSSLREGRESVDELIARARVESAAFRQESSSYWLYK